MPFRQASQVPNARGDTRGRDRPSISDVLERRKHEHAQGGAGARARARTAATHHPTGSDAARGSDAPSSTAFLRECCEQTGACRV